MINQHSIEDIQMQAYEALEILENENAYRPMDTINLTGLKDNLGEEFQHMSEAEFESLIMEVTADMNPEEVEAFVDSMGEIFGWIKRKVSKAAKWVGKNLGKVGAVAGGAIGSIIAPGVGTKIGAMLGGQLGKLVGKKSLSALKRSIKRSRRFIKKRIRNIPKGRRRGNNTSTKQLMALVKNPQFLKSLIAKIMGSKGEAVQLDIEGTSKSIPFEAFMQTISYLALQAIEENREDSFGESIPDYLIDSDGQYMIDPSSESERAAHLLALLSEDFQENYAEEEEEDKDLGIDLETTVYLNTEGVSPQHDQLTEWFVEAGWVR